MPSTGRTTAAAVVGALVVLLSGCSSEQPVSLAGGAATTGIPSDVQESPSAASETGAELAQPTSPPASTAAPRPTPSVKKKVTIKKASPTPTGARTAAPSASVSKAASTPKAAGSPAATKRSQAPAPSPTVARRTPSPLPPAQSGGASSSSEEAQVLALTNAERAKNGCGPLAANSTLAAVARAHSKDMATNRFFDHNSQDGRTPFDRMKAAGYSYSMAAENIAAGQQNPSAVVTAWMNSAGHRANILNCKLTQLGVGVYRLSGSPYGVYWTQDFGTPR